MKLTSAMIKEKAKELGIDRIAIGSIDRYKDAPPLMNPLNYFPECKSIIMLAQRIPRGTYRGILSGTHWHNYTFYSYNRLNTLFRPKLTYAMCCFIEDCGAEAIPHYPAVAERMGDGDPVVPGRMPNVAMSVRIMGMGAGLGEMGYSKVFITPEFGPRVRLGMIMTDAVLEPDPIIPTGTLCNHCGSCVRECPGNAIPAEYGPHQAGRGGCVLGRRRHGPLHADAPRTEQPHLAVPEEGYAEPGVRRLRVERDGGRGVPADTRAGE